MATDDQSLATKVENWLVEKIEAIGGETPTFAAVNVLPFAGTTAENVQEFAEEVTRGQSPRAMVRFRRDRGEHLEGGIYQRIGTYEIYIGVVHDRWDGSSRRGDGTSLGTNAMRDLVFNAIASRPNNTPALSANSMYAQECEWVSFDDVWPGSNKTIVVITVDVTEVPTP